MFVRTRASRAAAPRPRHLPLRDKLRGESLAKRTHVRVVMVRRLALIRPLERFC